MIERDDRIERQTPCLCLVYYYHHYYYYYYYFKIGLNFQFIATFYCCEWLSFTARGSPKHFFFFLAY